MIKILKKGLSFVLCLIIILTCFVPAASAAVQYPQGITKEQAKQAMTKLDIMLYVLLSELGDKSMWNDFVSPLICSDSTVSSIVKEFYLALSSNGETFSKVGISFAPNDVAAYFSAYPNVQQRLAGVADWNSVNLDGAVWGVSEETGFTTALTVSLSPLNELLYTTLCGGTYSLNTLIGITGAKGYENALLTVYQNFGIESYTSPETFYTQAATDRTSMVKNIVGDFLAFVKQCCTVPASKLSAVLPKIANYIGSGGLDNAITALVSSIKINILGITTPFQVGSITDSLTEGEDGMSIDLNLGDMLTVEGFQTAPIDLNTLASCGSSASGTFVADTADSFIYLFKWIIDTLKLNQAQLPSMISQLMPGVNVSQLTPVLSALFSKSTDEIAGSLISFITASSAQTNPYVWSFQGHTTAQVSYTQNLGREKYQRVLEGIDTLLGDFLKEGGQYKSLREAIQPQIYSNKVVTQLVRAVYSFAEDEKLSRILSLAGVDATPSALAALLTEDEFYGTSRTLEGFNKFSEIPEDRVINWGFEDGSRSGFAKAVCAALRPFDKLLRMVLAGEKITVLGSVNLYGSDGYNTAVIPVLEALGCPYDKILSYNDYVAEIKDGETLMPVIVAVDALIMKITESPVKTLTEILPNLMYFINGGGIKICIENLLYPVIRLTNELGLTSLIDLSQFTAFDINKTVSSFAQGLDLGITLPALDLTQFSGMGTLMTVQTHRTQAGQPVNISYVQADRTAVLITLLRYMVEVIKTPGNESLLTGFMSSGGEGGNTMFATYSQGIGDEMAKMTTDETVEWLYKLFFRERAIDVQVAEKEYMPTIIYDGKFQRKISGKTVSLIVLVLLILIMFAIINRERIVYFIIRSREKSASETAERKKPQITRSQQEVQ